MVLGVPPGPASAAVSMVNGSPTTYIGSPDLMTRNLDHRIEVLVPVENARLRQDVHAILDSALADDTISWLLGADGSWTRATPANKPHSHHATMERRAITRARRRARERRGV